MMAYMCHRSRQIQRCQHRPRQATHAVYLHGLSCLQSYCAPGLLVGPLGFLGTQRGPRFVPTTLLPAPHPDGHPSQFSAI